AIPPGCPVGGVPSSQNFNLSNPLATRFTYLLTGDDALSFSELIVPLSVTLMFLVAFFPASVVRSFSFLIPKSVFFLLLFFWLYCLFCFLFSSSTARLESLNLALNKSNFELDARCSSFNFRYSVLEFESAPFISSSLEPLLLKSSPIRDKISLFSSSKSFSFNNLSICF